MGLLSRAGKAIRTFGKDTSRGAGAGFSLGTGAEAYNQLQSGEIDPIQLVDSGIGGALMGGVAGGYGGAAVRGIGAAGRAVGSAMRAGNGQTAETIAQQIRQMGDPTQAQQAIQQLQSQDPSLAQQVLSILMGR